MSESFLQTCILWALMILLPMVPAIAIWKVLPSKGEVSGPLGALGIKFSGAFAAYLTLFLVLVSIRPEVSHVHYDTWTVTGAIEFQHTPQESAPNYSDVTVRFVPPTLGVMNLGLFSWEIPVREDDDGLHFPDMLLDAREYRGVTIPLGHGVTYGSQPIEIEKDEAKRRIVIKNPVKMVSVASTRPYAYNSSTALPAGAAVTPPPTAPAATASAP